MLCVSASQNSFDLMSVAVVRVFHDGVLSPPEEEVSHGGASRHSQAKPSVVSHHDQHQEVGKGHLKPTIV